MSLALTCGLLLNAAASRGQTLQYDPKAAQRNRAIADPDAKVLDCMYASAEFELMSGIRHETTILNALIDNKPPGCGGYIEIYTSTSSVLDIGMTYEMAERHVYSLARSALRAVLDQAR